MLHVLHIDETSVEVSLQPLSGAKVFYVQNTNIYAVLSYQGLKCTVLCCRKHFIGLSDSPKFCVKYWGLEGFSSFRFPNIRW